MFVCCMCGVGGVEGVEGVCGAAIQTGQCGNTEGWMEAGRVGGGCAATCQAWEPLCVYHRETVPTQNNECAVPLLNKKKKAFLLSSPPPPPP